MVTKPSGFLFLPPGSLTAFAFFFTLVQNFVNTVSSRPKGEILAALPDSKISRYARNDKYVTEFMKQST
jgi:hypothetical protein